MKVSAEGTCDSDLCRARMVEVVTVMAWRIPELQHQTVTFLQTGSLASTVSQCRWKCVAGKHKSQDPRWVADILWRVRGGLKGGHLGADFRKPRVFSG